MPQEKVDTGTVDLWVRVSHFSNTLIYSNSALVLAVGFLIWGFTFEFPRSLIQHTLPIMPKRKCSNAQSLCTCSARHDHVSELHMRTKLVAVVYCPHITDKLVSRQNHRCSKLVNANPASCIRADASFNTRVPSRMR